MFRAGFVLGFSVQGFKVCFRVLCLGFKGLF